MRGAFYNKPASERANINCWHPFFVVEEKKENENKTTNAHVGVEADGTFDAREVVSHAPCAHTHPPAASDVYMG